jgi:hypothetical protein
MENALMGLAVAVVLGCTAAMAAARGGPTPISALAAAPAAAPAGSYALVVFQIADCRSGMGFLRAFQDQALRGLPVQGLMIGSADDVAYAERRLVNDGTPMDVRAADRRLGRVLRQLGYDRTPLVLVLDADGRVRMASGAPHTPAEDRQLRTLLQAMASPAPR